MKEVGETQNTLSEKLEMTQGGLQHWLAGSRQPDLEDINRIAVLLRCSPAWLTHGIDPLDLTDGLREPARQTLRQLIGAERAGPLPASLWQAIGAMLQTVAPTEAEEKPAIEGAESPTDNPAPRNGTHG